MMLVFFCAHRPTTPITIPPTINTYTGISHSSLGCFPYDLRNGVRSNSKHLGSGLSGSSLLMDKSGESLSGELANNSSKHLRILRF